VGTALVRRVLESADEEDAARSLAGLVGEMASAARR